MAKRIHFTVEVDGEEQDAWIDLSSAVEKAANDYAYKNMVDPITAVSEVTGLNKELIADEWFGNDDDDE